MLKNDLDALATQVHRLLIENNLLRAASKEQRELNGRLRVTIKEQHLAIESLRRMMFGQETV